MLCPHLCSRNHYLNFSDFLCTVISAVSLCPLKSFISSIISSLCVISSLCTDHCSEIAASLCRHHTNWSSKTNNLCSFSIFFQVLSEIGQTFVSKASFCIDNINFRYSTKCVRKELFCDGRINCAWPYSDPAGFLTCNLRN